MARSVKTVKAGATTELERLLRDKLKASALDGLTGQLAFTLMQHPPLEQFPQLPGFLIPYWTAGGKRIADFWRYRFLVDTRTAVDKITGQKPLRYVQPTGSPLRLYMPPLVDWKNLPKDAPLFITEGELKAACACSKGLPTVGVGGVFSIANGLDMLLPEFAEIGIEGRSIYIVYDSDARHNTNVILAENRLANRLLDARAHPYIVRLPDGPDGAKQGLDDYLVASGADAFQELLLATEEFSASHALYAMNEKFVFVHEPLCVVDTANLSKMDPGKFHLYHYGNLKHMSIQVLPNGSVKKIPRPTAKEWLDWEGRRECPRVTYLPGKPRVTEDGDLNDWRGWGVEPKAGDVRPWRELMDFVFKDGDPAARTWFERWLAYPLQHPGAKLHSACVMWGVEQGTGKSMIGDTISKIYGKDNTAVIDSTALDNPRNEWAVNKQFVVGEEITGGDRRGVADRIKNLITQPRIRVDIKYIKSYWLEDTLNYYFTSNHPDAFYLEGGDRRFFIHELCGPKMPLLWYQKFVDWRDRHGGSAALFHYLLHLPLGDFNPAAPPPETDAKRRMVAIGRSDLGEWVAYLLDAPDAVLRNGSVIAPWRLWTAEELRAMYDADGQRKVTPNGISRELARQGAVRVAGGEPCALGGGKVSPLWDIRGGATLSKEAAIKLYREERGLEGGTKKKKF